MPRPGEMRQRRRQHRGLRRVDHDRRFDAHGEQLHHPRHLLGFVGPLRERHAHVQHVRAGLRLVARDPDDAVVVIGQEQSA